ncbi:transposase (plasmid) [Iamia sp. SCSIO 61187]|uniref:transposase n=1 Tax=Iamia sp. SCSIO 61187 TaxID=2722752 RepID=UPI001C62B664|nr:transposase [Iamia sp. SCSIO 61187]QYG95850.1 transposase [Iamia sp. SCSIO 61187]
MGRPAKYPAEFRREAVALVKSSGRPVAEVARSLEIAEGTLWNWMKADREADERAKDPNALSESERDELRRLRRKTAQQEIDLEILRKAAAYFARETMR